MDQIDSERDDIVFAFDNGFLNMTRNRFMKHHSSLQVYNVFRGDFPSEGYSLETGEYTGEDWFDLKSPFLDACSASMPRESIQEMLFSLSNIFSRGRNPQGAKMCTYLVGDRSLNNGTWGIVSMMVSCIPMTRVHMLTDSRDVTIASAYDSSGQPTKDVVVCNVNGKIPGIGSMIGSMLCGEEIHLQRKCRDPVVVNWSVPLLFVGDEIFPDTALERRERMASRCSVFTLNENVPADLSLDGVGAFLKKMVLARHSHLNKKI